MTDTQSTQKAKPQQALTMRRVTNRVCNTVATLATSILTEYPCLILTPRHQAKISDLRSQAKNEPTRRASGRKHDAKSLLQALSATLPNGSIMEHTAI